jgi:hypothetical protein
LHDGSAGGLDISAVSAAGDSISFYVNMNEGVAGGPAAAAPAAALRLLPARPNPSRGSVRLGYELGAPGRVRLAVYSVTGQLVATLADGNAAAGRHEVAWNGADRAGRTMASGVFFARLETASGTLTQRLTLLR